MALVWVSWLRFAPIGSSFEAARDVGLSAPKGLPHLVSNQSQRRGIVFFRVWSDALYQFKQKSHDDNTLMFIAAAERCCTEPVKGPGSWEGTEVGQQTETDHRDIP